MINVVYHCAGMGNWKEVVHEQFDSLKRSGLTSIFATHVGEGCDWFVEQALRQGIDMKLVCHTDNLNDREYHALLFVEQLAKDSDTPVLYFHTKGVSRSDSHRWRRLMQKHVVEDWQTNLTYLKDHDVVGVNWLPCSNDAWIAKQWWMRPHFCGNFWIAKSEWLRKLPPFGFFYQTLDWVYALEVWIGAAPNCRYKSLACTDQPFWEKDFDWDNLRMNQEVDRFGRLPG